MAFYMKAILLNTLLQRTAVIAMVNVLKGFGCIYQAKTEETPHMRVKGVVQGRRVNSFSWNSTTLVHSIC